MKKRVLALLLLTALVGSIVFAAGAGEQKSADSKNLTVYVAYQEDEAKLLFDEFEKETGIRVKFVRLSASEIFTRLQAEKANPQVSVIFGLSIDTISAAANEGLIESYVPSVADEIPVDLRDAREYWIAHTISSMTFAANEQWIRESGVTPPTSWKDLLKPEFKDNVSVAHPGTSGVAYAWLSSLVSLMGEDEAFDYIRKLDRSIVQYTKGGAAPARMAGLGETGVGLCWSSDAINTMQSGYKLILTYPEEGTPFEITGMAQVKGGPKNEVNNAHKFLDWAVGKKAQELFSQNFNRLPVNMNANPSKESTPFDELNTIKVDRTFASEERSRLIQKFVDEVRDAKNVMQ